MVVRLTVLLSVGVGLRLSVGSGPISAHLAAILLLLVVSLLSLQLLLVGGYSLLDLVLGSPDHIVDLRPDLLNLFLSIEALSHLLVGLDETFELLLEAIVLVVQVGHMLVESIDLGLELDLVSQHLLRVLLELVDLVSSGLLVLLKLAVLNLKLRELQLVVL
jgi:hypothetical protein